MIQATPELFSCLIQNELINPKVIGLSKYKMSIYMHCFCRTIVAFIWIRARILELEGIKKKLLFKSKI